MTRYIKIIMNYSARVSIIHKTYVSINKFYTRETSTNKWSTMAQSYLKSCKAKVKIKLLELNVMAHISAQFLITAGKSNYNVFFGRALLRELGISLDFHQDIHETLKL